MRKKAHRVTRRAFVHNDFGMETLEQRTMLSGEMGPQPLVVSARVTPTTMVWQGQTYTNVSKGSWVISFAATQSQAQATTRTAQIASALGIQTSAIETTIRGRFARIQTNGQVTEQKVANILSAFPFVLAIEPEKLAAVQQTPNDARYGEQWPHQNNGQDVGGSGPGVGGADIKSEQAWDISTGSKQVVIAVLDTGSDLSHPDLRPNLWVNPGEIAGNGIDDDQNGFVDDIHGWDFAGNDGNGAGDANPQDPVTQGHGTAVAGVIGAVGNNGLGVAGVNWNVTILTMKIFPDNGLSPQFAQLGAYEYCILMKGRGVNIIASNNSFGSLQPNQDQFNTADQIAIQDFVDAGMLYVAAAGNDTNDNDSPIRAYPASYDIDGLISVAATDNTDDIAGFSNYGLTSVDLGAPGARVLTTATGGGYEFIDGTSFASPYTAGVIGLMASVNRFATPQQLQTTLMATVDPTPAMTGRTVSGGRLNAFNAVRASRVEGLFVTSISPGTQAANVDRIDVTFSETIDPAFFNASKVRLQRANGVPVFNGTETDYDLGGATITLNGNQLTIVFPTMLPRDLFRLTLKADGIRDSDGNFLNGDGTIGNDEVYDFNVVSFRGPFEPNDSLSTASPLVLSSAGTAEVIDAFIGDGLYPTQDVDIFRVFVSGPSLITLTINARSLTTFSSLDSFLRFFDAAGQELAHNDNFEGLDSKLQVFVPTAGQYYIGISAFPNTSYQPGAGGTGVEGGSTGSYNLLVNVQTSSNETIIRTGGGTPIAIPTQGDIISTINVTDGRSVANLTVKINLLHTFVSDLKITLTGPSGAVVTLFDRRGGGGANLTDTVFSDGAAAAIGAGVAPFTGTFRPEQAFDPFRNVTGAGLWTLRISDVKPLDGGTLQNWSIEFTLANDITGPFELNDTTLLSSDIGINGSGSRTVSAFVGDGAFGLRDVDLFRFVAGTGTTITASVNVTSGSLKTVLRLFDALGQEVRADRRQSVSNNLITFVVANAGTYFLGVSGGVNSTAPGNFGNDNYLPGAGGSGNPTDSTGAYTLAVTVSGGISEGPVILTGSRLSFAINANGGLGLPTGSNARGATLDGLDYLLSDGNLNSFYGATFDGFVIRNAGDGTQSDLAVSVNNESDFSNRRALTTGLYRSLGVRRSISFGVNDQYAVVDVQLTNRSQIVINNLAWMEGLQGMQGENLSPSVADPANDVDNVTNRLAYTTINNQQTIALGAPSGMINVLTTFRAAGTSRDPLQLINDPIDPNGATGQYDMAVAYNVGTLAPNENVSFRYFIFMGSSLAQVTTMFSQLEAGTGTGNLVADPRSASIPAESLPYAIYYPEGFANSRANTFLPIVNGNAEPVRVVIIAHYEGTATSDVLYDSATDEPDGVVQPGKRAGITLTNPQLYADGTSTRVLSQVAGRPGVLKDTPYALEVRTSLPVGGTMSHYDFGITTGQSAISQLSTTWTFAQVQKGPGIGDVIVFYNPNTEPAKITFTTYPSDGSPGFTIVSTLQPRHRGGYAISQIPQIANGTFGVSLTADFPVIAAQTHFDTNRQAGYGATGLPSDGTTEGGTPQGAVGLTAEDERIIVLNTGAVQATVTFTFSFENASAYRRTLVVAPRNVGQIRVDQLPGFPRGQPYGVTYTSTVPVTVSLPSYTTEGASGATLTGKASTQWLFAEGFYPINSTAVTENLRIHNPSVEASTVEITLNFNDGTSEVFRRSILGRSTAEFNLFDFITGTRKTIGTVPGVGSFYGTRVVSSVPVIVSMNHYDAFLGGGFGMLGTPLGTIGAPA